MSATLEHVSKSLLARLDTGAKGIELRRLVGSWDVRLWVVIDCRVAAYVNANDDSQDAAIARVVRLLEADDATQEAITESVEDRIVRVFTRRTNAPHVTFEARALNGRWVAAVWSSSTDLVYIIEHVSAFADTREEAVARLAKVLAVPT